MTEVELTSKVKELEYQVEKLQKENTELRVMVLESLDLFRELCSKMKTESALTKS